MTVEGVGGRLSRDMCDRVFPLVRPASLERGANLAEFLYVAWYAACIANTIQASTEAL